jgi:hypothetical protein
MTLELDEDDYSAVQVAFAKRQSLFRNIDPQGIMPESQGNRAGALVAEICRAYLEFMERGRSADEYRGDDLPPLPEELSAGGVSLEGLAVLGDELFERHGRAAAGLLDVVIRACEGLRAWDGGAGGRPGEGVSTGSCLLS